MTKTSKATKALASAAAATAAASAAPATETPAADPFANLPTSKLGDFEVLDLSGIETSGKNVYKYDAVVNAAKEKGMFTKPGWKHNRDILVLNPTEPEAKAGTVKGDMQQIVRAYGKDGCPAAVLANRLRQAQVGNKRSKYCSELPPIGWAEGWIQGAGIGNGLLRVKGKLPDSVKLGDEVVEEPKTEEKKSETKAA